MKYYTIPPPPKLAPYVRFFWVFEGDTITSSGNPYVYRSMADGCVELIFHFEGSFDELSRSGTLKSSFSEIHGQSQFFRRFITRQFQRRFKQLSGFPLKLYARIIRFGAAMQRYGNNFRSLTDIAYECGYYDQSHFIHDFKEFSGYHPKQYFSGRTEGIEWRES
jgi:hypothetical protein